MDDPVSEQTPSPEPVWQCYRLGAWCSPEEPHVNCCFVDDNGDPVPGPFVPAPASTPGRTGDYWEEEEGDPQCCQDWPNGHAEGCITRRPPAVSSEGEQRPDDSERLRLVVMLAQEIGSAYRGDWSDFDGRSLRSELDELSVVSSGEMDAARFRLINSLCPAGRGHWIEHCEADCTGASS